MTQQISHTLTNLNSLPLHADTDKRFSLKSLKPHLTQLRKLVEQGDFRTRVIAQLRPGTESVPFWYGPARLQIASNTQATAQACVENGRITKLTVNLSKPIVLLNPVGSLVPSYIPCANILNNRAISIEGIDLTSDGHIVPRGTIKMYFAMSIHKFIPLQFCPMINTDATSFFAGDVVKSVPRNSSWTSREAIRSLFRLVTGYDIFSRFRPTRPIHHLSIENIDTILRGSVQASPTTDEFISEPTDAHVAVTLNKQQHVATLVQPHVRVSPSGNAHMHGVVQLNRAIPYAPTPPHAVDVDVALHGGECDVHAHSNGLLNNLAYFWQLS